MKFFCWLLGHDWVISALLGPPDYCRRCKVTADELFGKE